MSRRPTGWAWRGLRRPQDGPRRKLARRYQFNTVFVRSSVHEAVRRAAAKAGKPMYQILDEVIETALAREKRAAAQRERRASR